MNDKNFSLMENYIPSGYVQQGKDARRTLEKQFRILLEQGKLPIHGWNNRDIQHLLLELSLMDSNNFPDNCGVGEREARFSSTLVAERHFFFGHGIGRSGDIAEVQPKAAGSSILAKLTNSITLDILKLSGVSSTKGCLVLPVATGMALVLTLLALKQMKPCSKYVIWPRIDQKSCFKSILTAGLVPLVVENILKNGHLETDVESIEKYIIDYGSENILCVMTTTSCFAPRIPDRLEEVAIICKKLSVVHIVNNAYGVQSSKCMHLIQQANRVGRVDVFVQSTDKNFMVPVGGAIVAAFDMNLLSKISRTYPGRASASPITDLFITLLSLGVEGYKKCLEDRKIVYEYLLSSLQEVAKLYNESVVETRQNQISIAITLKHLYDICGNDYNKISEFGSFLFKRSVSGTRVVTTQEEKVIGPNTFCGWGAHYNNYPTPYLTAAAALGATKTDVDRFIKKLNKAFKHFYKNGLMNLQKESHGSSLNSRETMCNEGSSINSLTFCNKMDCSDSSNPVLDKTCFKNFQKFNKFDSVKNVFKNDASKNIFIDINIDCKKFQRLKKASSCPSLHMEKLH
ncbi:O-phosphoseryl-tRNA(Sec) selenium transferase isoform X1 [Hydra vulgaris]|uniref:O-phosphoseryl-tRNA(Sec) selenium transferase isoform X1 n=1 Tax=Hydra vulgaris TaxID=6087 RepID=UPI001F5E6D3A|nr:O-phosphoseryl-tRNA(Sec) selenium transferase [Hydra vulgaris]